LNSVTKKEKFESVHLSEFPNPVYFEKELEEKMEIAQKVVYLTRSVRAKNNLKVRQPLKKIMVVVGKEKIEALNKMKDVILEEVNIKELVVLNDDSGIVNKSAKANFKSIGPKFGKNVNAVANAIKALSKNEIAAIEMGESIKIKAGGEDLQITKDDVEVISSEITGWLVETEEGVTVALDVELDDTLIAEGLAREFVNRIQNMRKDAGFNVIDRIKIKFNGSNKLVEAVKNFSKYISNETLAEQLEFEDRLNGGFNQDWKIGECDCSVQIEKVKS
jgi:isoleucyl-tRNA synthetase